MTVSDSGDVYESEVRIRLIVSIGMCVCAVGMCVTARVEACTRVTVGRVRP